MGQTKTFQNGGLVLSHTHEVFVGTNVHPGLNMGGGVPIPLSGWIQTSLLEGFTPPTKMGAGSTWILGPDLPADGLVPSLRRPDGWAEDGSRLGRRR